MIDEWGGILSHDTKCRTWVPTGIIFTRSEDFERFPLADPDAPGRIFAIKEMRRRIGDEMALGGFIRDSFACAWEMFKINDFAR